MSDMEELFVRTILVKINDDDSPGLIIKESLGVTSTAEIIDSLPPPKAACHKYGYCYTRLCVNTPEYLFTLFSYAYRTYSVSSLVTDTCGLGKDLMLDPTFVCYKRRKNGYYYYVYYDGVWTSVLNCYSDPSSVPRIDDLAKNYSKDSYQVRLSAQPQKPVKLHLDVIPSRTARIGCTDCAPGEEIQRDQIVLNGVKNLVLEFDSSNWDEYQEVTVKAIDDLIKEGQHWVVFANQPSTLSTIQGPVHAFGAAGFDTPAQQTPLMLPWESDSLVFILDEDYIVPDSSSEEVFEENQADKLIFYNYHGGNAEGMITHRNVEGFNMGQNLFSQGRPMVSGVDYSEFEIIEYYGGDGHESVTIDSSFENSIVIINGGGGNDHVEVNNISGPVYFFGESGNDSMFVFPDDSTTVNDFVMFDGGEGDDTLTYDFSKTNTNDDIINITRSFIEVESLWPKPVELDESGRRTHLSDFFSVTVNIPNFVESEDNYFRLNFSITLPDDNETIEQVSVDIPYGSTPEEVELLISEEMFIWRYSRLYVDEELRDFNKTCGSRGLSQCSPSVVVKQVRNTYYISFTGEFWATNISNMEFYPLSLSGIVHEMFLNNTYDVHRMNWRLGYGNVETLDITTGNWPIVANIRGTSASTTLTTSDNNDQFFISSDANETPESALETTFLHGWLDYIEQPLTINSANGTHRLMISDENTRIPKGTSGTPVELSDRSLIDIHENVGDITFNTDGNWADDVRVWLGPEDDVIQVSSIHGVDSGDMCTTTMLNVGPGNDKVTVNLAYSAELLNEARLISRFVVNGQEGDDIINATNSDLPVIIFGNLGDDTLIGGSGPDVIFGDYGRVEWKNDEGELVGIVGAGGFDDRIEPVHRHYKRAYTLETELGGSDDIIGLDGNDLIFGGYNQENEDKIHGNNGNDVIIGDSGVFETCLELCTPTRVPTEIADCDEYDEGASNRMNDDIFADDGHDLVFGDFANVVYEEVADHFPPHRLLFATTVSLGCGGGLDTIELGSGDDIAFGANNNDTIKGQDGHDVIYGDFANITVSRTSDVSSRVQQSDCVYPDWNIETMPILDFFTEAGADDIEGNEGDDYIYGQEFDDSISGGSGNDDITGGHNALYGHDMGDAIDSGSDSSDKDSVIGENGFINRQVCSNGGYIPWPHTLDWLTFPEPFNTYPIREVILTDLSDEVAGDDIIHGSQGNDMLFGQSGNDIIYGHGGNDEIRGGLGDDELHGGDGDDILIGGSGYTSKIYSTDESPLLRNTTSDSTQVWHLDIVLEDVGYIKGVTDISKKIYSEGGEIQLDALQLSDASIWFVGGVYDPVNASKKVTNENGFWKVELMRFELYAPENDDLYGDAGADILIGGRGDDYLDGGSGDDFIVGDNAYNHAPCHGFIPRIYRTYRAMNDEGNNFVLPIPGSSFTSEFDLFSGQYRELAYFQTFVDQIHVRDFDDGFPSTPLIHQESGERFQPTFTIVPGFLKENQRVHGNDLIFAQDDDVVVGDDFRGKTFINFHDISRIDGYLKDLDILYAHLSKRLQVLEVDTMYYKHFSGKETLETIEIRVGCDSITANISGQPLVLGDQMTLFEGSVVPSEYSDREDAVKEAFYKMGNLHEMLIDTYFAIFEVHTEILERTVEDIPGGVSPDPEASSLVNLTLGNDVITMLTNGLASGDTGDFFLQFDSSSLQEFGSDFNGLARDLRTKSDTYIASLEEHLDVSPALSSSQVSGLPYDDIPLWLSVGADHIFVNGGDERQATVIGDYAFLGFVISGSTVRDVAPLIDPLVRMRQLSTPQQIWPPSKIDTMLLYSERYGSQIKRRVEPFIHGNTINTSRSHNDESGDFVVTTAFAGVLLGKPTPPQRSARSVIESSYLETLDPASVEKNPSSVSSGELPVSGGTGISSGSSVSSEELPVSAGGTGLTSSELIYEGGQDKPIVEAGDVTFEEVPLINNSTYEIIGDVVTRMDPYGKVTVLEFLNWNDNNVHINEATIVEAKSQDILNTRRSSGREIDLATQVTMETLGKNKILKMFAREKETCQIVNPSEA